MQWAIYMHNPADDAGPWDVTVYVARDPGGTRKVDKEGYAKPLLTGQSCF